MSANSNDYLIGIRQTLNPGGKIQRQPDRRFRPNTRISQHVADNGQARGDTATDLAMLGICTIGDTGIAKLAD